MKYDVHYTGQKLITIIIPLISITMAGEWRSRRNSLLQIVVAVYEMSDICSVVEGESHNTTRSTTIIDTNIHLKIFRDKKYSTVEKTIIFASKEKFSQSQTKNTLTL